MEEKFMENNSGMQYDFSVPRKENKIGIGHKAFEVSFDPEMTIRDGAERRDFTMNALAYDPIENKIYDYFGGLNDMKNEIIRHTSDKFDQDYLRILRLMNFQSRLGFKVHPDTIAIIRKMLSICDEFNDLSKERIFEEWSKWATKGIRHDLIFQFMRDTTLIDYYPELKALKETPQDTVYHPEGDVEVHTTMTLHEMDKIIERERIAGEEKLMLVMAILLHDIGKPATTKHEMKKGRMTITSNGHEALGGNMSREFLSRLGFHESLIEPISNIVSNHLAGVSISMIPSKSGKLKAVKKLSRRLFPATIKQLMYVIEADNRGRGGEQKEPAGMSDLAELSLEADIQNKPYEAILMGRHLKEAGLSPSPDFGKIIRASFEAQEAGEFNDIEGAKKWLEANKNNPAILMAKGGKAGNGSEPVTTVIDADVNGRGGLVVGDSHDDGGVPYVLEDSGTHIEEEGEEANLPNEIKDITEVYTFTGKNHEVIHKILQLVGLKLSNKVTSVRSGDLVICKASLWDDTVRTYTGTPIQIVSAVNESEGCNHIESGATMIENGKKVQMEKGGNIGESDRVAILYGKMSSPTMADGGRVPTKPAYLMTLDEYQSEVTPILKEYNKFVRKNDEYLSKVAYYGIFTYTFPEMLADMKADKLRGEHFRRNEYTQKLSDEKVARREWSYRKTRDFNENFKPAETPKGLTEQKNEHIKKLSKYFSDDELDTKIDKDETKSNKRAVRRAIDNDTYKNLLKSGTVTTEELQKIATSVGVNLPKKIFDPIAVRAQENKARYDKIYALMPKVNLEVLSKLVADIKNSFVPLEKAIYKIETERFHESISGIIKKNEANSSLLDNWMPFFRDIFNIEKEEERKHKFIDDRTGKQKEGTTHWIVGLSLKKDWKEVVSKYVLAEIAELRVSMIFSIISNFERITLPIKTIKQVKLDVGNKGFEGSYKFTFENGSSFIFKTEAIGAGGYNIQKFHFRYITHFTDIILADGTKASNRIGIVENFSVKEDVSGIVNPREEIREAETVKEIARIVYDCIKSGGTSFPEAKDVKKIQGSDGMRIEFNPNAFGKVNYLELTLDYEKSVEENAFKAEKFLAMIGARKYKATKGMSAGGETPTPVKELLKHLYKEHHNDFAIAKDLEATTPLDAGMNSERVIEMWENEIEEHFKEEEEVIFPRLKSMNITLTSDVESLIDTHNKFRNDIIPQVKEKKSRASVVRFASALKEHILDEEKLFKVIMPDPYKAITADDMEKGGTADVKKKLKKISAGYYEGEYKGIKFEIHKVEQVDSSTKNQWYWKIGEEGGDDWHSSKSIAILAVEEYIDENSVLAEKSGGEVNESNYFQNTKGEFEIISKAEYASIPSEEFVSEFQSRYKVQDGILYRSADHWGAMNLCTWTLKDDESVRHLLEGELRAGLVEYDEPIYAKIPFSSLSHNERVAVDESELTKVWVSMTTDPARAGVTPFIEVHPSLSIDDVKNVVTGEYPDYVYFKYKGIKHEIR